jgi:hypothetical protein
MRYGEFKALKGRKQIAKGIAILFETRKMLKGPHR